MNKSSTMQVRDEESDSQPCTDRNQLLYNSSFYLNNERFRLALGIFPARYIFTGLVSAGLAIIYGLKVIFKIH